MVFILGVCYGWAATVSRNSPIRFSLALESEIASLWVLNWKELGMRNAERWTWEDDAGQTKNVDHWITRMGRKSGEILEKSAVSCRIGTAKGDSEMRKVVISCIAT